MQKFIGFLLSRAEQKDFREVVNNLSGLELEDEVEVYHNEKLKNLNIPVVTASYFDKIQKGFNKLQEDCTEVRLVGFCQKEDIPDEAHREEFEEEFDHEYQLTQSDGYDEASFWGDIYLQLDGTLYMRFDVIG